MLYMHVVCRLFNFMHFCLWLFWLYKNTNVFPVYAVWRQYCNMSKSFNTIICWHCVIGFPILRVFLILLPLVTFGYSTKTFHYCYCNSFVLLSMSGTDSVILAKGLFEQCLFLYWRISFCCIGHILPMIWFVLLPLSLSWCWFFIWWNKI